MDDRNKHLMVPEELIEKQHISFFFLLISWKTKFILIPFRQRLLHLFYKNVKGMI